MKDKGKITKEDADKFTKEIDNKSTLDFTEEECKTIDLRGDR